MFPNAENFKSNPHNLRDQQKYTVNFARTSSYQKSFIPYAQKRLNEEYRKSKSTRSL